MSGPSVENWLYGDDPQRLAGGSKVHWVSTSDEATGGYWEPNTPDATYKTPEYSRLLAAKGMSPAQIAYFYQKADAQQAADKKSQSREEWMGPLKVLAAPAMAYAGAAMAGGAAGASGAGGYGALNSFDTGAMQSILNGGGGSSGLSLAGADSAWGANPRGGGMDWSDLFGTEYQGDFGYPTMDGGGYSGNTYDMGTTYQGDFGYESPAGSVYGDGTAYNPGIDEAANPGQGNMARVGTPEWFQQENLLRGTPLPGGNSIMDQIRDQIRRLMNPAGKAAGSLGAGSGAAAGGSPLSRVLGGLFGGEGSMDGMGGDLLKLLGGLGSAGLGAVGASKQQESLEKLARDQMAAEQARYTDQRDINERRYGEQRDINTLRYGDSLTRADAATARGVEAQTFGRGVGQPSRDRYEASYGPGFTMANDPGFMDALNQSSKATLHGLSVNGNPAGSPNAWAQSLKDNAEKFAFPALQQYRNNNATTGGFGSYNATGAGAPGYNAVGSSTAGFGSSGIAGTPSAGANESAAAIGAGSNIFGALGKGLANVTSPPQTLSDWIAANQNGGSRIFG